MLQELFKISGCLLPLEIANIYFLKSKIPCLIHNRTCSHLLTWSFTPVTCISIFIKLTVMEALSTEVKKLLQIVMIPNQTEDNEIFPDRNPST